MIKTIKITAMGLCVFISMTGASLAETLNDTLAETLARNPALAAANSTYEARYKEQFVTLSDMLPQVTAFATETHSETDITNYRTGQYNAAASSDFNSDSYGVQLTQNLFSSGKNVYAFRSKRAEVKAEEAKRIGTEQQIFLGAITAHLDVLQARSVLNLREKNLTVLEKQLEAVQDRFSVGVVTRTDVAQSRAAVAGAKSAKLGAEASLRAAEAVFKEFVGKPPAGKLGKPKKLPRMPRSLDKALDTARRENPTLKNAQQMSKSGKYSSYSTVGSVLPSVNLTGTYSKTEDPISTLAGQESEVSSLQVRLSVPLFLGGKSVAAISASRDVSNALKQNVHVASNTVEREVIVAWNNVQATKAAIEATDEQIRASELALDGVRQENTLGTRTNLDVLNAEQRLLDARVALVQAERNQYVAAYNLIATTGRLTAKRLRIKPAEISKTE